jgi:hypothetical protein
MTISLDDRTSDQYDNYYWSCLKKISLNSKTIRKLDEIMLLINQTNYTHTVNKVVDAYLEILKERDYNLRNMPTSVRS